MRYDIPTNPMGPLIATTRPVTREAKKKEIFCTLPTETPLLNATSSDVLIIFSIFPCKNMTRYAKISIGNARVKIP